MSNNLDFAVYGRCGPLDMLKIVSRGVGTFSTPGEAIPRIFEKSIFLWIFLKSSVRGRGAASGGNFPEKHAFLLILNKTIKTRDAILSDFLVVSRRDLCSEVQW